MDLILEKELEHQEKALDAIMGAIGKPILTSPRRYTDNPLLPKANEFKNSIIKAQEYSKLPSELRVTINPNDFLNLDIKMETGTGKTYTYTKAIYELNRLHKLNKFIIVVPTLSIKSGTEQFLKDPYVIRHFRDELGYDKEIKLNVVHALKGKVKGRAPFPEAVRAFVSSPSSNTKDIQVLLVNSALLTSGKVLKQDYDTYVEGFYNPLEAIRSVNPVVIIDEPHKFVKTNSAYKAIRDELQPQLMLRFGATFPDLKKNKFSGKDYENLVYELNARDSFNNGLVKGVAKEHFGGTSNKNKKIKLKNVVKNDYAEFDLITEDSRKSYQIPIKSSMGIIDDSLSGIILDVVTAKNIEFSNGIELKIGEQITADTYMESYQKSMIDLALTRHFETERENFNRIKKIKTLALFFIDDIHSYRDSDDGEPYLNQMFEELLEKHIKNLLLELDSNEDEYRAYLEASLKDLRATHGGYFAEDKGKADKDIADEVDEILHNKKKLLSFFNEDGSYNTRRFIFSKWTLKEGWDNPNIFTICKLRSSGSEISKLQEVGRGLRLPVNEQGNRVSTEEFMLNYIVDFTEANFAQKLVDEINHDVFLSSKITEEQIQKIAKKRDLSQFKATQELINKGYIDEDYNIVSENLNNFAKEYPEIEIQNPVKKSKIKDRNKSKKERISIRSDIYQELRELWETINQRFILFYNEDINDHIEKAVVDILLNNNIFAETSLRSTRSILASDGDFMNLRESSDFQISYSNEMPYGQFLKKLSRTTNIPIKVLNKGFVELAKRDGSKHFLFNERALQNFNSLFNDWKINNLFGRYNYKKSKSVVKKTALSNKDGSPKRDIPKYRIGVEEIDTPVQDNYLYDALVFDSDLEKENLLTDFKLGKGEVFVYGKIPRSSIAIPLYDGGTYSPDFMYVVKRPDGGKELNLVVETKGYDSEDGLSGREKRSINSAKKFFDTLSEEGIKVHYKTQLNTKGVKEIIEEIESEQEV